MSDEQKNQVDDLIDAAQDVVDKLTDIQDSLEKGEELDASQQAYLNERLAVTVL